MKKFLFSNCTIIREGLFLVGVFAGLPAKVDLFDGRIEYYDEMEGFVFKEKSTIVDFFDSSQDKVYALDSGEDQLVIWDLNQLKCRYIRLGCCHQPWINFVAFEKYRSDYYIFPKYENKVIVFHTDGGEITEISGYLDHTEEVQCACRVEDDVWILPQEGDHIYCYELTSGKKRIFDLKRSVQDCVHSVFHQGNIYILNRCGAVYRWNIERADLQEVLSGEAIYDGDISMGRILCAGNNLMLFPAYGSDIKILDLRTKKTEIYRDYPEDYDDRTEWWKYYGYCEDESHYYFAAVAGNYLLKIEKRSGKLIWIKLKTDSLGGKTIDFLKKRSLQESDYWELTDLMQIESADRCGSDVSCVGEKIYRAVKDR